MKTYNYEVHDEFGKIRVFYALKAAEQFAGHEYKIVRVEELRKQKAEVNFDQFEPALF